MHVGERPTGRLVTALVCIALHFSCSMVTHTTMTAEHALRARAA